MPPLYRDWRLYVLLLATLLLASLAYQVAWPAYVDIGTLGDRTFLWASPLQADLGFNGDEHLAEEGLDYRWTKRVSWLVLPDMAWNGPLRVTLHLRGWRPENAVRPLVEVRLNGAPAGRFQPSGDWEEVRYELGEYPGHSADLEVLVESSTFSPGGQDRRLLGVQWDWALVEPLGTSFPVRPPWSQLFPWAGAIGLLYAGLRRRLGLRAFFGLLALPLLLAAALVFRRHWLTPWALPALAGTGALFLLCHAETLWRFLRRIARRAQAVSFHAALIGSGSVILFAAVRWAAGTAPTLAPGIDALFMVVFVAAAIVYALITWDAPLKGWLARLDGWLRRPWLPAALLALLLAGITTYEFLFVRQMHFIGHADYADNAVVARNLLAGKGFTVDYVAQFYNPNLPLPHEQETWPLLQPVLIAPSFFLLGDSPWAAKVPNLVLQVALAVALYLVGRSLFDRRVALAAVALTLFNPFIFRLIIFPTSDLAFTLLALLTLAQFYRATSREQEGDFRWGYFAWAGLWAGLMMLAKPIGALFVLIALLWDLLWRWRQGRWHHLWQAWLAFGLPAAVLLAPWLLRNLFLFGTPVYSTEQFDAWILKYRDWEEIYRLYDHDVPNRSWLLRYGFDAVFQAIGTEFTRWWNYFTRDSGSLLTLLGSALALGGLLTLRRHAARLFSLVGAVLLLFGTFICVYWHVEERYFLPFIPWLALLIGRALWWVHDTLAYRRNGEGRPVPTGWGWLGLVAVILACIYLTTPFSREATAKMQMDQDMRPELQAYQWLAGHSGEDEVIMTRIPWQVAYYTRRATVMIPQDGLEAALEIAARYGVDYLLMEGDAAKWRPTLRQALQQEGSWELLYNEAGVQIYRFPQEP